MNQEFLQTLIDEATVDCYGEDEEFWGFLTALGDLPFPFQAKVLGDRVIVTGIADEQSSARRGVQVNLEKRGRTYVFPLAALDVTAMPDDDSAAWVAAYQLWSQ